jgi:6-phosphogluconolactonase
VSFTLRFDPSGQVLIESAAATVATSIFHRWKSVDNFHLVLTGGSSGIQFAHELGKEISRRSTHGEDRGYDLTQKALHLWFSDERFVEFDDADRNDSAVLKGLENLEITMVVHRALPPSQATAAESASEYDKALEASVGEQLFDFTILGFGNDGHLASCFPGENAVLLSEARALPIEGSPKPPPTRTTITLSQLSKSRSIFIFAIGENKKEALVDTLASTGRMPAEILASFMKAGEPIFYTDIYLPDQSYTTSTGETR